MSKRPLLIKDVCNMLGLSIHAVRKLGEDGVLSMKRTKNGWRIFDRDEVLAYKEKHRKKCPSDKSELIIGTMEVNTDNIRSDIEKSRKDISAITNYIPYFKAQLMEMKEYLSWKEEDIDYMWFMFKIAMGGLSIVLISICFFMYRILRIVASI